MAPLGKPTHREWEELVKAYRRGEAEGLQMEIRETLADLESVIRKRGLDTSTRGALRDGCLRILTYLDLICDV